MAICGAVLMPTYVFEALGIRANVTAPRNPIAKKKAVIFMSDV